MFYLKHKSMYSLKFAKKRKNEIGLGYTLNCRTTVAAKLQKKFELKSYLVDQSDRYIFILNLFLCKFPFVNKIKKFSIRNFFKYLFYH